MHFMRPTLLFLIGAVLLVWLGHTDLIFSSTDPTNLHFSKIKIKLSHKKIRFAFAKL